VTSPCPPSPTYCWWRNPTVTIKNDRIIVKGNIDIDGVVNSTAIQSPTDAAGDGQLH
jgi:hypothetical protein